MVRLSSIAAAIVLGAFSVSAQDFKDVDTSVITKDHNNVLYVYHVIKKKKKTNII
jgi:hypothetical protein